MQRGCRLLFMQLFYIDAGNARLARVARWTAWANATIIARHSHRRHVASEATSAWGAVGAGQAIDSGLAVGAWSARWAAIELVAD